MAQAHICACDHARSSACWSSWQGGCGLNVAALSQIPNLHFYLCCCADAADATSSAAGVVDNDDADDNNDDGDDAVANNKS